VQTHHAHHGTAHQEYAVTFKIKYETKWTQQLYVIGDIAELGNDSDLKRHPLKWTAGHIWVSEKPLLTCKPYFRYSYIMMKLEAVSEIDDQEKGIKRIADLASIGSHGEHAHGKDDDTETIGYYMQSQGQCKHVEIFDIWRAIKVKFTVLHTRLNHNQSIRLTGNIPSLGNWNKVNPIQLTPALHNSSECNEEHLIPYEASILIEQPDIEGVASFNFNYSYAIFGGTRGEVEWERDPPRRLEILKSENYKGEQGAKHVHQFSNTNCCYFINGIIDKNDGFFNKNFHISRFGNTNVFMGAYPSKSTEVQELKDQGITAVINLQTHEEISQMGIDWHTQMNDYRQYSIDTAMHYPVANDDDQYKIRVFAAAQYLNDLINNKDKKVFIHCTSGIVRCTTVVLAYLCLYKRVENW